MNYFLPFLFSVLLSVFLTGIFFVLGKKFNIVSAPRKRDVHIKLVPRIGGPAIFISFLVVTIISFIIFAKNLNFVSYTLFGVDEQLFGILAGGLFITGVMIIDDLRGIKPSLKFFLQLIATIIIIASGVGIDSITNPFGGEINLNSIYIPIATINGITYHFSLWSDLLTVIWLVGMMNVINFVDGVDGLAAGVSSIAAVTLFFLSISVGVNQPATAMISIILAGSTLGFLIWNFPPAKIFMGDSGSMFLGFMLGTIPLISGGKLATAFLVLGFPIIDGLFVAVGRIIRKENPFSTPDKTHLHHRFLRAGYSVRQSILFLYLIATAFAWVALRSTTMNKLIAAGMLVLLLIFLIQGLRIKSSKLKA